ncbi:transmembrane protein 88B-like [Sinocyclocheilus rhinocerous]|uniref:transmembrane protein 88B-like n=1 Tax=Sinocyclocheilus rhinocerous TaxID=307959 RepID=UPI0007B7DE0E|nr:PREDICTED: transmembrane protein 88B-like [Sinocyclocheilus rhinocerous]
MCGMTVLLDDGGGDEDFDVGDGIRMLPPPPAQCDGGVWGARRGHCGCVLWTLLLLLWNVLLLLGHTQMPTNTQCSNVQVVFLQVVASQAALCHYLDDNSCSALIILGFVMMSPLVVVAAATFCALLRRLHLLLYFQPITEARYQGRGLGWRRDIHAWV